MNSGRARGYSPLSAVCCVGGHAVDGEGLEGALVLVEVGKAEVADGVRAAFDALDQDVVVFGELDVLGGEDGFFALVLQPS